MDNWMLYGRMGMSVDLFYFIVYLSPTLLGPMSLIVTHQWARDSWCMRNLIHWKGENVNGHSSKWRPFPTIFLCFLLS